MMCRIFGNINVGWIYVMNWEAEPLEMRSQAEPRNEEIGTNVVSASGVSIMFSQ